LYLTKNVTQDRVYGATGTEPGRSEIQKGDLCFSDTTSSFAK